MDSFLKEIKKKTKKRRRVEKEEHDTKKEKQQRNEEPRSSKAKIKADKCHTVSKTSDSTVVSNNNTDQSPNFDYRYIMAPMVGASELAFRLLCRNYGTQLCYTPMMSAQDFAIDPSSAGFQTTAQDRPLVCHFWANKPADLVAAAKRAASHCDAIDLNLGCPQRTAYLGHFGSYLLDPEDRKLICDIVRATANAVDIPVFCKIRLLDTEEKTLELVRQLRDSGAALVAIHARYRASWERKGPGARDGPAHLDQITRIREQIKQDGKPLLLITNGNTITWNDVEENLKSTGADGLMSAEGLLDDPALFLSRLKAKPDEEIAVTSVAVPSDVNVSEKRRKTLKKLRKIENLESKSFLDAKEKEVLASKDHLIRKLAKLDASLGPQPVQTITLPFRELHEKGSNKLTLARDYLDFASVYPVQIRSVIFHVRRILKEPLDRYQLMGDCLQCTSIEEIRTKILDCIERYQSNPTSFVFDQRKAQAEKQALALRKEQEGKRKEYEARMMRKAKREGRDRLHYLQIGAEPPTRREVAELRRIADQKEAMQLWKEKHSQHCFLHHISECPRGRTCAFLHMECADGNNFQEQDELAG
jgi:tRNA-dihydrouridine synthase 1